LRSQQETDLKCVGYSPNRSIHPRLEPDKTAARATRLLVLLLDCGIGNVADKKKEIHDVRSIGDSRDIVKNVLESQASFPANRRREKKAEKLSPLTFHDERSTVSVE
jgi:hypothetical protein